MTDYTPIEEAAESMGLKMPVTVELHQSLGQAKAKYIGVIGGTHRIAIAVGAQAIPKPGSIVGLPDRGESLWHELTHALQCERDFDGDDAAARVFYHADVVRRLRENYEYTEAEAVGIADDMGAHVRMEMNEYGHSLIFDEYQASPWEVEARQVGASFADFPLVFRVHKRTRSRRRG